MSTNVEAERAEIAMAGNNSVLWRRQLAGVLRFEIRKNFLGKRAILIYLLAALPLFLIVPLAIVFPQLTRDANRVTAVTMVHSGIFEGLTLRTVIFFGCAWMGMNLFRGEVVDRSLHYYFLTPVRREILVLGKYLAGLVTTTVIFGTTTFVGFVLMLVPLGASAGSYLMNGYGFAHLADYLLITTLACLGYTAAFLAIGLIFRNPIVPALVIYGWEFINFLLPPLLKKISVVHYLRSLSPVPMPEGPFAMLAEPTPAWIAIPGLLVFTVVVLAFAAWRIRAMEISYGTD